MFRLRPVSGINPLFVSLLLSVGLLAFQCEKEPLESLKYSNAGNLKSTGDSLAIHELPEYYNLLETLKKEGYVFEDFRTFLNTDSSRLPEKLIVIRHDIHSRDIQYAYPTYDIEEQVIGPRRSTFYVLLDDPAEMTTGTAIESDYMKFLRRMKPFHVDIQPHISPIDMYIADKHPVWEHYSVDSLKTLFSRNYAWDIGKTGRRIEIKGRDVFHINDINHTMIGLLANFNEQWTKQTGLPVMGYSAHGTGTAMNKVLNNACLLDQYCLLDTGLYKYDTYNTKILKKLTYLSDNTLPSWMNNPASIKPGRYEFLMHPYQWRTQGNPEKYQKI